MSGMFKTRNLVYAFGISQIRNSAQKNKQMKYKKLLLIIFLGGIFVREIFASESRVQIEQNINSKSNTTVIISGNNKPTIIKNSDSKEKIDINVNINSSGSTGVKIENNINIENNNGQTKVQTNSNNLKKSGAQVQENIKINGQNIIDEKIAEDKSFTKMFIKLRNSIFDRINPEKFRIFISDWFGNFFQ